MEESKRRDGGVASTGAARQSDEQKTGWKEVGKGMGAGKDGYFRVGCGRAVGFACGASVHRSGERICRRRDMIKRGMMVMMMGGGG